MNRMIRSGVMPDFDFLNPGLRNFQKMKIFFSSIWLFLLAKCMFSRVLNRMESTSLKWKMCSFWVIRFLKSQIYKLYMYRWKWNYTKTKLFLLKWCWFHSIRHPQNHTFSHSEQLNWWKKNRNFLWNFSKSRVQNIKIWHNSWPNHQIQLKFGLHMHKTI